MLQTLQDFAASQVGRRLAILTFLALGIAAAIVLPPTIDEFSRIEVVRVVLEGDPYSFFWPPGNILIILANPLFHLEIIPDLYAVRIFNFLIAAIPIAVLIWHTQRIPFLLIFPFLLPYLYLVMSTASQQGLMIPLLLLLLWAVVQERRVALFVTCFALYLVNPGMIVVVPAAFLALVWRPPFRSMIAISALAYVPIAIIAVLAWLQTGSFLPTLSGNGAYNLFLGNNADPLSHRGIVAPERLDAAQEDFVAAVWSFLVAEPAAFFRNLLNKAALYWAPWDYLRSGLGGSLQTYIFGYVAIAQLIIYVSFFTSFRRLDPKIPLMVLSICIFAWLLYTAFFVKVRFRVPFDILMFLACLFPATERETRRATS